MEHVNIARSINTIGKVITREEWQLYLAQMTSGLEKKSKLLDRISDEIQSMKVIFESEQMMLMGGKSSECAYLGIYNKMNQQLCVAIPLIVATLIGHYIAYDVLQEKELGIVEDTLQLNIGASRGKIIQLFEIR